MTDYSLDTSAPKKSQKPKLVLMLNQFINRGIRRFLFEDNSYKSLFNEVDGYYRLDEVSNYEDINILNDEKLAVLHFGDTYSKSLKDLDRGAEIIHIIGQETDLKEPNGQEIFTHEKEVVFFDSPEEYLRT